MYVLPVVHFFLYFSKAARLQIVSTCFSVVDQLSFLAISTYLAENFLGSNLTKDTFSTDIYLIGVVCYGEDFF